MLISDREDYPGKAAAFLSEELLWDLSERIWLKRFFGRPIRTLHWSQFCGDVLFRKIARDGSFSEETSENIPLSADRNSEAIWPYTCTPVNVRSVRSVEGHISIEIRMLRVVEWETFFLELASAVLARERHKYSLNYEEADDGVNEMRRRFRLTTKYPPPSSYSMIDSPGADARRTKAFDELNALGFPSRLPNVSASSHVVTASYELPSN